MAHVSDLVCQRILFGPCLACCMCSGTGAAWQLDSNSLQLQQWLLLASASVSATARPSPAAGGCQLICPAPTTRSARQSGWVGFP